LRNGCDLISAVFPVQYRRSGFFCL
jgi:hypothetical protein